MQVRNIPVHRYLDPDGNFRKGRRKTVKEKREWHVPASHGNHEPTFMTALVACWHNPHRWYYRDGISTCFGKHLPSLVRHHWTCATPGMGDGAGVSSGTSGPPEVMLAEVAPWRRAIPSSAATVAPPLFLCKRLGSFRVGRGVRGRGGIHRMACCTQSPSEYDEDEDFGMVTSTPPQSQPDTAGSCFAKRPPTITRWPCVSGSQTSLSRRALSAELFGTGTDSVAKREPETALQLPSIANYGCQTGFEEAHSGYTGAEAVVDSDAKQILRRP
ncbi:hypothetical protein BGW80DRAFT_1444079 [Lactifluus volemus]|nr:hypothetical protein BGW80DRAFT_1444079 [Lactifluus volemus]